MKETILKVPLLHQPKGSFHCAVTSMRMIMAYNGDVLSHDEAVKNFPEVDKTQVGITPRTARFLVQSGYNVTYKIYQNELVNDALKSKTEKDLEFIKEHTNSTNIKESARLQWEEIFKFIEAGGSFSINPSTLDDIDWYLEKGVPVRIGVKCSIFYSEPNNEATHAVVIVGKRDDEYLINDPAPRFTESYWIHKEKLLEAWRANGSLLLVATKESEMLSTSLVRLFKSLCLR